MQHPLNKVFFDLINDGRTSAPRGQKIIELEDYTYSVKPDQIFCNQKARGLKLDYIKQEFIWYVLGRLDDLSIAEHAKLWASLTVDGQLNSNYGYYWFTKGGVNWVVKELSRDRDSRRAVIPILGTLQRHLQDATKDVPCTESAGFRIRDDKLKMTVHMRSQDAVFGLGNDVPCFSFLHRIIHALLLPVYPGLQLGPLTVTATSFHIYERHFELLPMLAVQHVDPVEVPQLKGPDEAMALASACHVGHFLVHPGYEFSGWLLNVDPDSMTLGRAGG